MHMTPHARMLLVLTSFAVAVLISVSATAGVVAGLAAVVAAIVLDRYRTIDWTEGNAGRDRD